MGEVKGNANITKTHHLRIQNLPASLPSTVLRYFSLDQKWWADQNYRPLTSTAFLAKNRHPPHTSGVVTDCFSQVLFQTAKWKDELAANLLKYIKVFFFFSFFRFLSFDVHLADQVQKNVRHHSARLSPLALMRTFQSAILKWTYVDIEPFLQSILWALSAEASISWIL